MCGILGQANKSAAFDKAFGQLSHRGPDGEGRAEFGSVIFGHKRLSILDLSARSSQPMTLHQGKLAITFNGEIYNFAELRSELEKDGVHFLSTGDTEVILKGYERHGIDFFKRLQGMWAFAIYDARSQEKIILNRDPFGIKPLYYSLCGKGNTLVFGSELRSVASCVPELRPNKKAYAWFFNFGYFAAPDTCYEEVSKLEPGRIVSYDLISRSVRNEGHVELFHPDQSFPDLRTAVTEAVRAHYVSDVPVGVLFSGGTDSSLIAAVSKSIGYSPTLFHVEIPGSADVAFAKKIAEHIGLPFEAVKMDPEVFVGEYEKILNSIDEPNGDLSLFVTHLLYSLVAGKSKVVLGGEGGDELFGGYYRHGILKGKRFLDNALVHGLYSVVDLLPVSPVKNRLFALLSKLPVSTNLAEAYVYEARMHPYGGSVSSLAKEMEGRVFSEDAEVGVSEYLHPDLLLYLRNSLMYKGDISSMRYSIEARTPFLDRKLFSFLNSYKNGRYAEEQVSRKSDLKGLLAEYVPANLVSRPKSGFSFPIHEMKNDHFESDVKNAVVYHIENASLFGMSRGLVRFLGKTDTSVLLEKYPRLAFALLTNWRLHRTIWVS